MSALDPVVSARSVYEWAWDREGVSPQVGCKPHQFHLPEPSTSMPGNGGIRIASPFTQSFLAPYIRRVEGVDLCRFV